MPKIFTETEREYIKKRLHDEAKICLLEFGVKKTTVDELVKRVKIPKGTFYLFYKSKELLFFEVFCSLHNEINEKLFSKIADIKGDISPTQLTEIIFGLYKMVEDSFMLKFVTNGEMEFLIRKLPSDIAKLHAKEDDLSLDKLLSIVPNMKAENIRSFSAALRGIFLSMLYRHEIGEDVFDDALKIMINGVVIQMF